MPEKIDDSAFCNFLISRGIPERDINRLIEEKIDEETLSNIDDSTLSQYIPKLGDRIALKMFCQEQQEKSKKKKTKRSRLFEILKTKMETSEEKHTCNMRSETRKARKPTRKVEIGWIHNKKQVRKRSGGGTRKLDVPIKAVKEDLIKIAKDLFFPDGSSPGGNVVDFEFDILDFKETPLPINTTVNDCYDKFKTGLVTFYLSTCAQPGTDLHDMGIPDTATGEQADLLQSIPDFFDDTTDMELMNYSFGQGQESLSTFNLVETGTPTVTFNLPGIAGSDVYGTDNSETTSVADDIHLSPDDPDLPTGIRRRTLSLNRHMTHSSLNTTDGSTVVSGTVTPVSRTQGPYDAIEVIDSEDEQLQQALQQSLQDSFEVKPREPEVTLKDIIHDFQTQINKSQKQEIIISRRNVLESAFRALRRPFNCTSNLYIKFSGELGLDHGGPRREFFRLALKDLSMSSLFEGPANSKFFSHDLKKLEDRQYFLAGKLVGLSVLHDGPGIGFINNDLAKLMLGIPTDFKDFNVDSIPECRDVVKELREVDSHQKRDNFLSQHGDWLVSQGYTNAYRLSVDDFEGVIEALTKQFIYYRTLAEIHQFTEGIDSVLGLWRVFKTHSTVFLPVLCFQPVPLSKDQFMNMLSIKWSDTGSNRRIMEEETIYSWELFLQDIQDKTVEATYEDLLIFITGANTVPTCGFESNIMIEFYVNEANVRRLPFSSTCSMTLSLPRGKQPEELKDDLMMSLKGSCGFDKV